MLKKATTRFEKRLQELLRDCRGAPTRRSPGNGSDGTAISIGAGQHYHIG